MGDVCPWPGICTCTHIGCLAGWVDNRGERAVPCPRCRPEVARHLRTAPGTLRDARAGLRRIPRPSRKSRAS